MADNRIEHLERRQRILRAQIERAEARLRETRRELAEARQEPEPPARRLKQAALHMWFEGSNPNLDPPDEEAGVMQGALATTQRFAGEVLEKHWNGECGCQR